MSTQRNEGINSHAKRNCSKKTSLKKLFTELIYLTEYQHDKSQFKNIMQDLNIKESATTASDNFKEAHALMHKHCSDYAMSRFFQQASVGSSSYKVVGKLVATCPEDSPDEVWTWAPPTTSFSALETLDKCDAHRSSSVRELIQEKVADNDYLCFAVQHERSHAAPQIVVLHGRAETAGNNPQYLKFFCTCGFSTRYGCCQVVVQRI